jgi:anti-anti-sigma factor
VTVDGDVDSSTFRQLDKSLADALDGPYGIIDLSGTGYVNSGGMTVLIKHTRRLAGEGGALVLAGVLDEVESVFSELGLLESFTLAPDVEAAVARLEVGEEEEAGEKASSEGTFPVHISCVECSSPLTADRPGKYQCPRCQIYFEVDSGGRAVSFPARSAQSVELSFPCGPAFVELARGAAGAAAKSLEIPSFSSEALDRAVDEAMGLYAGKIAEEGKRLRMFVSGDSREFTVAFVTTDPELALTEEDREGLTFRSLKGIVDELDVEDLSPEGQVLKLVKRFDY